MEHPRTARELAELYYMSVSGGNAQEARELLSSNCFRAGKRESGIVERKVESWEKTMADGRSYSFDRKDEAASNDSKEKFFFTIENNGTTASKPCVVVKEGDDWYIDTVTP